MPNKLDFKYINDTSSEQALAIKLKTEMKAYNETQKKKKTVICKPVAALFFHKCPKECLESIVFSYSSYLKKKKNQFFLQFIKSLSEPQASPRCKCFIFQMPLLTRENVIQDKKAVTTLTTNTEFFGSVFAMTILAMYSHCLQIWFIQLVSRGNH